MYVEILMHLDGHSASSLQAHMLQLIGAGNIFANLPEEKTELYKSIAQEVSQSDGVLMITIKAVWELKDLAEFVQPSMPLALWHLIYHEYIWMVVALLDKEDCVEIFMDNAIFLVRDPESSDLKRLNHYIVHCDNAVSFSTSVYELGINKLNRISWYEWILTPHSSYTDVLLTESWDRNFPVKLTRSECDRLLKN